MRIYSFFSAMLLAGVIAAGAHGQGGITGTSDDLTRGANDLPGKAANADGALRDSGGAAHDSVEGARRGAQDALSNARDGARDGARDAVRSTRENTRDLRRGDLNSRANLRGEAAGIDTRGRGQASANFDDADRNADWRFVNRDGTWWYRTPANTWMMQRDGRWVNHRGGAQYGQQENARRYDGQVQSGQYVQGDVRAAGSQANYEQDDQQAYSGSQTSYTAQGQSREGHQEWMCIDGRRRLVTVRSVRPVDSPQASNARAEYQQGQTTSSQETDARYNEQGQRHTAARALTPPPAPTPDRQVNRADRANLPEAPSRDAILGASADAESSNAAGKADANARATTDNAQWSEDENAQDPNAGASTDPAADTQTDSPLDRSGGPDSEQQ